MKVERKENRKLTQGIDVYYGQIFTIPREEIIDYSIESSHHYIFFTKRYG